MVTKEKTVRQYTRKSKTGKTVTVKQHTAKYNSAEDMAKAALQAKKGSGKELQKSKDAKIKDSSDYGFTPEEYKEWYHWDFESDPKNKTALKVEKELKSKMGAKKYKSYFDEMTDGYTARGHNKAYNLLNKSLGTNKNSVSKVTKVTKSENKNETPYSTKDAKNYKDPSSRVMWVANKKERNVYGLHSDLRNLWDMNRKDLDNTIKKYGFNSIGNYGTAEVYQSKNGKTLLALNHLSDTSKGMDTEDGWMSEPTFEHKLFKNTPTGKKAAVEFAKNSAYKRAEYKNIRRANNVEEMKKLMSDSGFNYIQSSDVRNKHKWDSPKKVSKTNTSSKTDQFFNKKTGKPNFKNIEKAVGHKLDSAEKDYCYFYYGKGKKGLPKFGLQER